MLCLAHYISKSKKERKAITKTALKVKKSIYPEFLTDLSNSYAIMIALTWSSSSSSFFLSGWYFFTAAKYARFSSLSVQCSSRSNISYALSITSFLRTWYCFSRAFSSSFLKRKWSATPENEVLKMSKDFLDEQVRSV